MTVNSFHCIDCGEAHGGLKLADDGRTGYKSTNPMWCIYALRNRIDYISGYMNGLQERLTKLERS